jgi:RNA polymerase sigma-70 factor (ECF subfamily)
MTTDAASPDLPQPTDAQLVAASRFDGVHFATVIERHVGGVHRYLARRLGAPTADAFLGECVLAAYTSRRHFRPWQESARPWLTGVATNVVRKQWRMEQARLRGLAVPSSRLPAAAAADVVDRLQHLSARDRDMVILAAWEDLSAPAVAQALDLPESVVVARLDGAGRAVQEQVRELGGDGPTEVEGLALVRSLRPAVADPSPELLGAVRCQVAETTGAGAPEGRLRPTSSIAAEREQLRRWRSGPTARLAARRVGRTS